MDRNKRFFTSTMFRYALVYSFLFVMLQLIILFFTVQYSDNVQRKQEDLHTANILRLCSDRIENTAERADRTLEFLLTQDAYLRLLDSSNRNAAYHAWYELNEAMNLSCFPDSGEKTYIICNRGSELLLEKRAPGFSYADMRALESYLAAITSGQLKVDSGWYPEELNGKHYLIHYYTSGNKIIMGLVDLSRVWTDFMPILGNMHALIVESSAYSFGYNGAFFESNPGGRIGAIKEVTDLQLTLSVSSAQNEMAAELSTPLAVVVSCILSLVSVYTFVLYLHLEYNRPIKKLRRTARRIKEGDFDCRAQISCRNRELQSLADLFNSMLDTIMQLKIEQYENIIRHQDAELKYYYMQIRPHFYLNALASVQSMSLRGENQRISEYILALSKNIRYMFSAGFCRVQLSEELEHIDDYIRCQEIPMQGCVFSYIDVTSEAGGWMVPQMILHTFVENIYKHVVSADRMVTLLVRAEVVYEPMISDERLLCLIVEDDGHGFPDEIVEAFREKSPEPERLKNCIGLMNVRRTLELMYGRNDLIILKNNLSAGTKVTMYIPAEIVAERRKFI